MEKIKKVPIGIEQFEAFRKEGLYYVDKTGLNNMNVFSITDARYDEHFGFLDQEVRDVLDYYGLTDKYDLMKGIRTIKIWRPDAKRPSGRSKIWAMRHGCARTG